MFEQLLVLSNMSEKEGGEASFSIDMFDPSNCCIEEFLAVKECFFVLIPKPTLNLHP